MSRLSSAIAFAQRSTWTESQADSLERNFGIVKAAFASFFVGASNLIFITQGTRYEERIMLAAYSGYLVLTALTFYSLRRRAYNRYLASNADSGQASLQATQQTGGYDASTSAAVSNRANEDRLAAANTVEMVVMGSNPGHEALSLLEEVRDGPESKARVLHFLRVYNDPAADFQISQRDLVVQWTFISLLYVINAATTNESIYYHKALSNFVSGVAVALIFSSCCSKPSFADEN